MNANPCPQRAASRPVRRDIAPGQPRRRSRARGLAAVLLALAGGASAEPVTLRLQGAPEPNATSAAPAVSADGSTVVFRSLATNLGPAGGGSLFAWSRATRTFTALAPTANGNLFNPSVSVDGRYVAFETNANNLAPGLDSSFTDVLRLDRLSGNFERASQGFAGSAANSTSESPAISGDGRRLAFVSLASNLVSPASAGGRRQVYEMDMDTGLVEMVSRVPGGAEGDRDALALEAQAMSSDGNRLVFTTGAENLTPVFAGNVSDVIVRTRNPVTGAISFENVNRSAAGAVGSLSSNRGSISPNGRWVVFRSGAQNIVGGGSASGLYLRDLSLNTVAAVPLPPGYTTCNRGRVADNGDVAMQCAPAAPATALQVLVVRKAGGTVELQSASTTGAMGNGSAGQAFTLSADASLVAFESLATNHIAVDANTAADVFLRGNALDTLFADSFENQ